MKIKISDFAEMLVLFFAGLSGVMIWNGNIWIQIIGILALLLNSYFLVSNLKRLTIIEFEQHKNRDEKSLGAENGK